jgi:hypothetical protein
VTRFLLICSLTVGAVFVGEAAEAKGKDLLTSLVVRQEDLSPDWEEDVLSELDSENARKLFCAEIPEASLQGSKFIRFEQGATEVNSGVVMTESAVAKKFFADLAKVKTVPVCRCRSCVFGSHVLLGMKRLSLFSMTKVGLGSLLAHCTFVAVVLCSR